MSTVPLTVDALIGWLNSIAPQPPQPPWPSIKAGPYINEMPDRLITVTLLPGLGFSSEGAMDQPTFQVRVRSEQTNQATGELLAQQIDACIFNQHFPQVIQYQSDELTPTESTTLVLVARLNGAPAPLGPPDDAYRYDYVCTYRAVVGV
jgi:hypothetical protein